MEIVMMNINEIIPYENNPRKNDDAVEAVANSIKNFGFKSPIVVDANKVVVNDSMVKFNPGDKAWIIESTINLIKNKK